MKKKGVIAGIFIAFLASKLPAQTNLVMNGSFETFTMCPMSGNSGSPDIIKYAVGWYSSFDTPDYYNACSPTSSGFSTPKYGIGYQQPFDGQAYCGFEAHYKNFDYRTSLSSELANPLSIGQKYFVSLKINLCDHPDAANYGVNKIGALFSTQQYIPSAPPPVKNYAQVYTNAIITDSINWTSIQGSFVADSIYKFINISSFFDNAHTDTSSLNPNSHKIGSMYSYYFVDDIRVSTDSLFGLGYVGIKEFDIQNAELIVSPNPTNDFTSIEAVSKDFNFENSEIRIINMLGSDVTKEKLRAQKQKIDLRELPAGIYFLQLYQNGRISVSKKIIKE